MTDANELKKDDASKPLIRPVRLAIIVLLILVVAGVIAVSNGLFADMGSGARANAIMTIAPYRHNGTWVFDDASAGLVKEPFVAGVPEMIDVLVKDVPNAENGFRMLFSANEFPGYQKKLTWLRGDKTGNWYSLDEPSMEGWICPAMFKYYDEAPKEVFVKAEAME